MKNNDPFEECPYLTTEAAARFLGLSPKTLEYYRYVGGGPRFRKHGRRVLYLKADLEAWSDEHAFESTSQAEVARA